MERRRDEGFVAFSPPWDGRAWGRSGGQADAMRLGGRARRVEEVEEGVGGFRGRGDRGGVGRGRRSGCAGSNLGDDGCAVALFELVAVGVADLDAGGVAAQHLRFLSSSFVLRSLAVIVMGVF